MSFPSNFQATIPTVILKDDDLVGVREGIETAGWLRLIGDLPIAADCRGRHTRSIFDKKGEIAAEYIVRDLNF